MVGERLGPLRERPFRLLWFGRLSSAAGDAVIPVALAFGVLSVSRSPTALGVVLAAYAVPRVALTLVGGVYADRLPRRTVMVACDVVRGLAEIATAVLLLTGHMTLPLFVINTALFGAASAFYGPASTGLVPQTVSAGRLQEANALLGLSQSGTRIFGPLVSGVLVATVGAGWVFALDAGSFAASAIFLVRLGPLPHAPAPESRFVRELARGFAEVRARAWVWTSMLAFSVSNLCFASFLVLGPVVARDELGGARAWGTIGTGGALGAVVGGTLALRLRPRRPLAVGLAAWALFALPLLALARPLPALAISAGYACGMGGIAFGNTIWETILQERIPREVLARVSSYDWLVSLGFMPIGFVLFGPLANVVGIGTMLVAAAAATAGATLVAALAPAVRAIASEPTPEGELVPAPAPQPRAAA